MKIVDWITWEAANGRTESLDGMGGVMEPLTRADFLADCTPESHPYVEAIWAALDERGPISGDDHQNGNVPVYEDGTVARMSMRAWGDLVAAWWNTKHPDALCDYCAFAWGASPKEDELLAQLSGRAYPTREEREADAQKFISELADEQEKLKGDGT